MDPMNAISALIREAKAADADVRISDFQIEVAEDHTVLLNLKTGATRRFPAPETSSFEAFERAVEELALVLVRTPLPL
jgi:hypothetical protein